jgi:hypothetical protein
MKPREFFICDETDNSGLSVMPWSEKEAKRQYGSCNVMHVREVVPIDDDVLAFIYDQLNFQHDLFRFYFDYDVAKKLAKLLGVKVTKKGLKELKERLGVE